MLFRSNVFGAIGKEATIGSAIDYQGIPYYMEQMNEWVRSYTKAFNDIMTQEGSVDNYGNKGKPLFKGDKLTDSGQWDFADSYLSPDGESFSISSTDNSYYRLTAFNFAVDDAMLKDPDLMATHTNNADNESKYDIVDELIDLKTNVNKMKFRGSSASQFLQCILSDVSLNGQSAKNFSDNYSHIAKSIDTQRLSVSGVDEDEEAMSLVKYREAYNLACKMVQTLTEIYDRLILETGV